MQGMKARLTLGFAAMAMMFVVGCPQILTITTEFPLNDSLGKLTVQAGQPATSQGTVTIQGSAPTLRSGTFTIDRSNMSFTPGNTGGKGTVNAQGTGNTFTVTAKIAATADVNTVCDTGESYGPFTVTLNADNVPTSVDPSEITLTQTTVDLINSGGFAICLEVSSTVDGTVDINALTFKFGI